MPGLLAFTLALNNQQFKQATAASTAVQNKFTESLKITMRTLAQQAGTPLPEIPPLPDPDPGEKHSGSLRHFRHELSLVGEIASQTGTEVSGLGHLAGLAFR